jgi:hypothetical protein
MIKSNENIAYHEAGHAVAYFEFGKMIRNVTIVPSEEYLGCCFGYCVHFPSLDVGPIAPAIREQVENEIINFFIGALAEKRFLGRRPEGWIKLTEIHNAVDLASNLTGSNRQLNAYLSWLYVIADEFIYEKEEHWEAIQAIAQELLKKKTLYGKEAHQIWRNISIRKDRSPLQTL